MLLIERSCKPMKMKAPLGWASFAPAFLARSLADKCQWSKWEMSGNWLWGSVL